jgi:hypothetical protein
MYFLICMDHRFNCRKGAKINIFGAEQPKIAVFAPKAHYLMHYLMHNYTKKAIAALTL